MKELERHWMEQPNRPMMRGFVGADAIQTATSKDL
jgi:hypothetical protein